MRIPNFYYKIDPEWKCTTNSGMNFEILKMNKPIVSKPNVTKNVDVYNEYMNKTTMLLKDLGEPQTYIR